MAARRGKRQARRNGSGGDRPAWVWLVAGVAIAAVVFLAVPGLFKGSGDGFARFGPKADPDAQPAPVADSEALIQAPEETAPAAPPATQYDFYTVLPGNEVRMSDAELAASARAEQARREQEEARRAREALEGRSPTPVSEPATTTATAAGVPAAASETVVPPAPAAAATPDSGAPAVATASATDARYILQAGAFGASGDAEQLKARLAMLGLSARVESGQAGGRTVYRVRMGPYGTAGELAEAKAKLASSGVQAMAIKAQ
jgi:cell division protein FtsN